MKTNKQSYKPCFVSQMDLCVGGDSSRGDVSEAQVETPKAGGVSPKENYG